MNDEFLVSGSSCSPHRQLNEILDYGQSFDSANVDAAGSSATVILYNTITLPLYPAPVGRRLDWTFADSVTTTSTSANERSHQHRHLQEPQRPRGANHRNEPNTKPNTLDLIPDDVHSNQTQHLLNSRPIRNDASSSTTMSNINKSNSRFNTLPMQRNLQLAGPTPSVYHNPNNKNHHHRIAQQHQQQYPQTRSYSSSLAGVYGWRKKCLFVLIFGLLTLIVTNLALTLWILKVMEFSSDGMGSLKVVAGGLQLSGQALVLDLLKASTIRSRQGQPISIESSKNFSVNTRDWEGRIENQLFLGHDRLDVLTHSLKMFDVHGAVLLAADKNEVRIGANVLRLDGEGGIIVRESLQTAMVRAEPGRELKFESPTRSLHINAGQDVLIKSAAGSLDANCLNDIRFHSEAGSIRLDSSSIVLPNLKAAQPPAPGSSTSHTHSHKVYQLCACANGKLFMAQSHSICAGDEALICR